MRMPHFRTMGARLYMCYNRAMRRLLYSFYTLQTARSIRRATVERYLLAAG